MSNLRNINKYIVWDQRRQQYVPHYWRKEILPSWIGFDPSGTNVTQAGVLTVVGGGGSTPPADFKQPYSSVEGLDRNFGQPFEIRSLLFADSTDGQAAADWTVMLREVGEVRQFMNNPVHIRTLAGSAQNPYLLREPYFFLSQHSIQAQLNKTSAGNVNVRMFLAGAQYYPWSPEFMRRKMNESKIRGLIGRWLERRKYITPFWLTTEQTVNLGANATGTFFLKVGDDGHFEGFTLTSVQTGNFAWEISEPKTNQTLMNGLATQTNSLGDSFFPTLLPTAYFVPSGYRLRLTITDLSGAPNEIFFTMGGRKLYVPMKDIEDVKMDTAVPTPADTPSEMVPAPLV